MENWGEVDRGQWRQEEENEKQGGELGSYHLVFQMGGYFTSDLLGPLKLPTEIIDIFKWFNNNNNIPKCPNKTEFII